MRISYLPFGELIAQPESSIDTLFLDSKNTKMIQLLYKYVKYNRYTEGDFIDYSYIFGEQDRATEYLKLMHEEGT